RIDAAVLDGALARRLKSKGFYVIAELTPANIQMVNQAIVVSQEFLQKRADVAEKILMALVESLAYTLAPQNKAVVTKTMMTRFHISDPTVPKRAIRTCMSASNESLFPRSTRCATSGGSWPYRIPKPRA